MPNSLSIDLALKMRLNGSLDGALSRQREGRDWNNKPTKPLKTKLLEQGGTWARASSRPAPPALLIITRDQELEYTGWGDPGKIEANNETFNH